MKYILLPVFFLFSLGSFVRGQSITLTPSTNTIDVNTTFGLTVQVDGITNPGEVQIQGIDKFIVRGQAQSTSMQLVNGQQSVQVQLQLQLQPSAAGSFAIGPARIVIGTGEILSNSFTIDVTGEKLFLQPQQANTLLGVQEEQIADIPVEVNTEQNKKPASRSWLRVVLIGFLVLVGGLRKKYASLGPVKKTSSLMPVRSKTISTLPPEDDELFRMKMDLRWRNELTVRAGTNCVALTMQELIAILHHLPSAQQELFRDAFTLLQQARYADGAEERHGLVALAHRLVKLPHHV